MSFGVHLWFDNIERDFHKKSENSCDEQPQTGTKGEVKKQRFEGDHVHLRGLKLGKGS